MRKLDTKYFGIIVIVSIFFLGAQEQDELMKPLLLALVILLPVARLAGWLVERVGQPAVLGELLAGMVLGNLSLVGVSELQYLKSDVGLEILSGLGVILLLFEIGLDASLADLYESRRFFAARCRRRRGLAVRLGWSVSALLLTDRLLYVHTFIGATLCATSVGITARVLQDIDAMRTQEARIILGAAVIDDVLGLLILAVVSGIIVGADRETPASWID